MNLRHALLVVLACATIYSCATAPRPTVDLMPPSHLQFAVVGGGGKVTIVVRDARAQPSPVAIHYYREGNAEHGHGDYTDTLNSNADVVSWIRSALSGALEQSGFRIYQADSAASASTPLVLKVGVKEVLAEAYNSTSDEIDGEARILLRVELYGSSEVKIRNYSGSATRVLKENSGDFGLFGERVRTARPANGEYATLLAAALTNLLRTTVPDLASAINAGQPSTSPIATK